MKVNVLFFGSLTEKTGRTSIEVKDVKNISDLINKMTLEFYLLKNSKFAIALNQIIVKTNKNLKNGDVIALLPPFSGG